MKNEFIKKGMTLSVGLIAMLFFVATSTASDFKTVVSNAGGVRIEVKPLALSAGSAVRFKVGLSTHSVELDQDMTLVSILRDNQEREYKQVQWDGAPPGGHHRQGILVFSELAASLTSVTLTIHDVAGIAARDFTWQLNP